MDRAFFWTASLTDDRVKKHDREKKENGDSKKQLNVINFVTLKIFGNFAGLNLSKEIQ